MSIFFFQMGMLQSNFLNYFVDSNVVYKESMSLMLGLLLIPKIMLS